VKAKVVAIGEVLWDLLPAGRQMGGAPANFACHVRSLGADGRLISRVGDDSLGREIIARLQQFNIPTDTVTIDRTHPTGTVTVELSADGQPCFTIRESVAWDHLVPEPNLVSAVLDADAVCFGTLAQRSEPSRTTIIHLVATAGERALRVFDVNLRQCFYSREMIDHSCRVADVLKLNDAELATVARFLEFQGSPREQMIAILDRYELRMVACTRGAQGSILFNGRDWCEAPGQSVKVVDSVGAGDAFTAAMVLGIFADWPLARIAHVANEVAAYVCSCPGATPPLPAHLRAYFQAG